MSNRPSWVRLGSFILLNECKIWKNYRAKCRSKGTSAEKFLYMFVDLEYERMCKCTKSIAPHFNTFLCKFMGYIFLNISPAIHCTFLTTFSIEEKIITKRPKCRFNIGILKKSSKYIWIWQNETPKLFLFVNLRLYICNNNVSFFLF